MTEEEALILPSQEGLKDAYIAALKMTIAEGSNDHWLSDIITTISADCGVSRETTMDRIKMLVRFNMIQFLSSSIGGHRYRVMAFKKMGQKVEPIEKWGEFKRLAKDCLDDLTEPDLVKVHKMMKGRSTATSRKAMKEAMRVFDDQKNGVIILPGTDIKSKLEFEEQLTREDVCQLAEKELESSRVKDENSSSSGSADSGD